MALLNDFSTFATLEEQMHYEQPGAYGVNNETIPFATSPSLNNENASQQNLPVQHLSNSNTQATQREAPSNIIQNRTNGGGNPKQNHKPRSVANGTVKENFEPNNTESLNLANLEELNKQLKYLNDLNEKNIKSSQSIFDLYANKKKDIFKFLSFALIAILALAINKLIEDFYIDDYIADLDTTFNNKLMLRLAYPLAIVFILWTIKVYT
jgi:hypothetical protein